MKLIKSLTILSLTGLIFASCGEAKKEEVTEEVVTVEEPAEVIETPNIVGVASGNADFSTLVTAVGAAELVETLSSDGPFTVFAPTNAAFEKLPAGTVETLLKPESKDKLIAVLTYHVVAGKFEAAQVIEAINANNGKFEVATVQGGKITLSLVDGKVVLTDANGGKSIVVIADVAASNGVIHAIDTVVMPK
ncbi:fasciclin domain-containing protein [Flavobacterium lacus]|uniref:Putative surface protein with fasciclin (FAS1) repeats n=1 Tax=Flavobacterium lacus TaxID=1353778 RepID=A0A328X0W9_9FLAO|nr:fasciclin domain-containing protein [Flavobacterium lacus]RAR49844.1 putative surface protein with fasciclin (FAS1) repeats [Flavobacterium lacus]